MKRCADMAGTDVEKLKAKLDATIVKGVAHTLKDPIPVIVTLDNGEIYKGVAFEVRPNGLIMVRAGNCDVGVQLPCISTK
jgi:hypothetical protein